MESKSASQLAYVGSKPTNETRTGDRDAWFTPAKYLEAARTTFGGHIDLDPFSDAVANRLVQAGRIFTLENSALTQDWDSPETKKPTVWMNPPYGKACKDAVAKFLNEFLAGHFTEGIVLTNNATETKWFQMLLGKASAICLTDHRIGFYNIDGKRVSNNTRGQCFFYFGDGREAFRNAFSGFGSVITL